MNATAPSVPSTRKSGLAVWSLVFGILAVVLSFACVGPLFGIPAVICGHMAHSRIKRSSGVISGGGLAIGGLITGYISFAMIPVIAMMAAIAIPNFVKARDTAQRHGCINFLRQIDSAKQQWALENAKDESAIPAGADLDKYINAGFANLKCPKGGSYTINAVGEKPACSIDGHELPMLQPFQGTPR